MSETFDNPRDRRKAAQENLAATVYYSQIVQQVASGTLYMSVGRSGLSTDQKLDSVRSMLTSAKLVAENAEEIHKAAQEAVENLQKAVEQYALQASSETPMESIDSVEDFLKGLSETEK